MMTDLCDRHTFHPHAEDEPCVLAPGRCESFVSDAFGVPPQRHYHHGHPRGEGCEDGCFWTPLPQRAENLGRGGNFPGAIAETPATEAQGISGLRPAEVSE